MCMDCVLFFWFWLEFLNAAWIWCVKTLACKQGAELMGKHGINVPKGVTVSSVGEVKKAIQEVFPNEKEVSS